MSISSPIWYEQEIVLCSKIYLTKVHSTGISVSACTHVTPLGKRHLAMQVKQGRVPRVICVIEENRYVLKP